MIKVFCDSCGTEIKNESVATVETYDGDGARSVFELHQRCAPTVDEFSAFIRSHAVPPLGATVPG